MNFKRETIKKDKDENDKDDKELKSTTMDMIIENTSSPLLNNQVQDQEYWLKKAIEYETNSMLNETPKTNLGRTTRRKAQLTENMTQDSKQIKQVKSLQLASIKEMLFNVEETLSEYLKEWNSRWAKLKIKEEIVRFMNKPYD